MPLFTCLTCLTPEFLASTTALVGPSETSCSGPVRVNTTNMAPPDSLLSACEDNSGNGLDNATCTSAALQWINVARKKEHLPPVVLPPTFDSLSRDKRMVTLVNLERKARHLPPVTENASHDRIAMSGARAYTDPVVESLAGGQSNWAGVKSPTEAMFLWMYCDGPGHGNETCKETGYCYGHRKTILGNYGAHPKFGTAYTFVHGKGDSLTQVFSD